MSDETDFTANNELEIPDVITDFGDMLRVLRNNHAYSLQKVSKMIGLPVRSISQIENCEQNLPAENILRLWLNKLGCGKNTNKLLIAARQFRVKHWIKLERKESSNPDMLRLIDAYKRKTLTNYDRALLKILARR